MIIVDIETSGKTKGINCPISIGAIDFESKKTFYEECRIVEGAEILQEALDLNGFTIEQIRNPNKKSVEEMLKGFFSWTGEFEDKTLAGQHIGAYDRELLENYALKYAIPWPFGYGTVDLHSICYNHMYRSGLRPIMKDGRAAIRSSEIYKYVGMPSEPKPHNALNGAKWEAEAFSRLIIGKNLLEEFKEHQVPRY